MYDIIVVGAGHAGCEAAHAAALMGHKTCLITINLKTIAQMSCNPAIGGLAKGHLVREIDALGGLMGKVADQTGIHFRLLNRSRGGAVQAPRAQSEKIQYQTRMKFLLEKTSNLTLIQGKVQEILIKNNRAFGIVLEDGEKITTEALIITPGTFLNGLIHIGLKQYQAGRINEPASNKLGESIKKIGFRTIRLKTGTPMRLHRNSIDWSSFSQQHGDKSPVPFSFQTEKKLKNKITCYIGRTTEKTGDIIKNNLDKSPLFSGIIKGIGPRYCPSIEDKVIKFPHHPTHHIFLEPEGIENDNIYVNGLSSSLPINIQKDILKSIPGLHNAQILQPAYGIEYDAIHPKQLDYSLETKKIKNLFFAGQINGTSGYEEAAAQGLMAGINAGLKINKAPPFILRRDEAYIGVLIDDLITQGIEEPYRLFTSRAEYRLLLRIDNADKRLTPYGFKLGLISKKSYAKYHTKQENTKIILFYLNNHIYSTSDKESISLAHYLRKPKIHFPQIQAHLPDDFLVSEEEIRHIESEIKYEGYIKNQEKEIARILKGNQEKIPENFSFQDIPGLTKEIQEKIKKRKPQTVGEIKIIPGITPAAINSIQIYLKLQKKKNKV